MTQACRRRPRPRRLLSLLDGTAPELCAASSPGLLVGPFTSSAGAAPVNFVPPAELWCELATARGSHPPVGLLERLSPPVRPSPNPPIAWAGWVAGRSTKPDFFNVAMGVVFMFSSTAAADWQPQATDGKPSQGAMSILSKVATMHTLDACVIEQASFSGCLVAAAHHSGKEDQEIADEIHICHGYMSRFMRGVAQQWARRLVAFMRATQSLAPLQWMANQMGCDVVVRHRLTAELVAARARVAELERGGLAA